MAQSVDFPSLAMETIQSQYGASPHLVALVSAMARRIDPSQALDLFFSKIFDPRTAEGIGLDYWGRIVGISRYLEATNTGFLGFSGSGLQPFDCSPFFMRSLPQGVFKLSDTAFRFLIFYKATANVSTETMEALNALLNQLFSDTSRTCFVLEAGVMHIRAVFLFVLTEYEVSILKTYALLNRGAGVGFSYYQIDTGSTFGFFGSGLQPFGQGAFQPFPEIDVTN